MSKTMADHARAYRQRKAAKLARLAVLEEALREISDLVKRAFDGEIVAPWALDAIDEVAKSALNHTTEAGEEVA